MESTDPWLTNKNFERCLLEDPAISPDGNVSFRVNVETDAANVSTASPQDLHLHKENHSDIKRNSILPEPGNHLDNRRLVTQNHIEAPKRTCLAGSQIMQHLVRGPSRYDYLPSAYGSDILNNGFCSSGATFQSDSRSRSFNFGADGSMPSCRFHSSPLEERQQSNAPRSSNHKNTSTIITDVDGRANEEFTEPKATLRDDSTHRNSQLLNVYNSCSNCSSHSTCTLPNLINLTGQQTNTTSSDFTSYSSTPALSSRTGQEKVLDQNYDTLAKSMLEMTDGSSRPTSRASSSVRMQETSRSNGKGKCEYITSEVQVNRTTATSSPPGPLSNLIENRTQRTGGELNTVLNHQISDGSQPKQPPFNGHDHLQSINSTISEDINLATQLNQLNLNYSGHNDANYNSTDLLINLLLNNSTITSSLNRPIYTGNEVPQSLNDWNSRACQSSLSTSANILSNQLLNLLAKSNPSLLSAFLTSLESGQTDVQQFLLKLLNAKLNMTNNGSNNCSLLSSIGSLLSNDSVKNNNELMDTLTSQLAACAARYDSGKAHHYPPTIHSRQNIRPSTNFSNEFPFSSLCYRLHVNDTPLPGKQYYNRQGNLEGDIDRAATMYRNSANNASQKLGTLKRWSGKLPMRNYNSKCFSRKVFLGGVPWDSTNEDLINTFCQFGNVSVLWPQKDGGYISHQHNNDIGIDRTVSIAPKGYCYLLFEHESCVADLLEKCTRDASNGGEYFKLSSPKYKSKSVQVIPWVTSDSQFSCPGGGQSFSQLNYTVFVGALHGMITAEALASIMNELFGNVIFAALDTDKHKYPIGSGRVMFCNQESYLLAVTTNFVEIRTPKFTKTIQIDPFLEDSLCDHCRSLPGVYFCRALDCFRYFCPTCWQKWHSSSESNHKPLRRSLKLNIERV